MHIPKSIAPAAIPLLAASLCFGSSLGDADAGDYSIVFSRLIRANGDGAVSVVEGEELAQWVAAGDLSIEIGGFITPRIEPDGLICQLPDFVGIEVIEASTPLNSTISVESSGGHAEATSTRKLRTSWNRVRRSSGDRKSVVPAGEYRFRLVYLACPPQGNLGPGRVDMRVAYSLRFRILKPTYWETNY